MLLDAITAPTAKPAIPATIAVPVGVSDGKSLLLRSIAAAKEEGRPRLGSPLASLFYMAKHAGAFNTLGGGIAVGSCRRGDSGFSWPIIEIEARRYLRGIDVTDSYRPNWPEPEVIEYDESWCAALDRKTASMESGLFPEDMGGSIPAIDIDTIDSASVFLAHDEPPEWSRGSLGDDPQV